MAELDRDNPAVQKSTELTPALLLEAQDDPAVIRDIARSMLLIQMDQLFHKLVQSNGSIDQRQKFVEFLSKVGDVVPKASSTGTNSSSGFSVQIVIGSPQKAKTEAAQLVEEVKVIDATPPQTETENSDE